MWVLPRLSDSIESWCGGSQPSPMAVYSEMSQRSSNEAYKIAVSQRDLGSKVLITSMNSHKQLLRLNLFYAFLVWHKRIIERTVTESLVM